MATTRDAGTSTGDAAAPRRRHVAVAAVLLLAAGVAVAIVLGTRSSAPSSSEAAGTVAGATSVQRRDLVETDTESGTLGYAYPQTVYNRLRGTITWLPAIGRVIRPGHTLYGINGRPVALLDGARPAYRALEAGDGDGWDIRQLNRDLVRMGFAKGEITIDDAWQAGTTDAVKRWQASLGEKRTGKIGLGRVVFLPGAQRVTQLEATRGSTGSGAGSASPILQTTSTQLVVTVDLDASKQSEAKAGESVTVEMPAGATVDGRITAVSSVAQRSNGSSSSGSGSGSASGSGSGGGSSGSTIPVTIALSGHRRGAGLDQASVSVNFARARARNVLSVPVTALLATDGGSYAVQEASPPHKLIRVTTGLFAAGHVQISGAGIHPGLDVTDSQG